MTFLNFIKNSFDRVLSLDTEFRFDETMTIPKKVLCFCYMDIFTGEKWEFWEHDKPTKFGNHFDNTHNASLTCAFNKIAYHERIGVWGGGYALEHL